MERKAFTIRQLRATLAESGVEVGKKAVIHWLVTGQVKGAKVGGRWYVPASEVDRLVRPLQEQ